MWISRILSPCRQREEEEEEEDDEDYWSLSAIIAQTQEMREREDAALGLKTGASSVAMTTSRPGRMVMPSSYFSDEDDSD